MAQRTSILALLCFLFAVAASAAGPNWPRFRGPNGTGESEAEGIPTRWQSDDYLWHTELPGIGHSSPVVWGNRLFIQSALPEDGSQIVLCLDARTGERLWQNAYPSKTYPIHLRNSFASSTPAVDARRVYVVWGTPERITLLALDHEGHEQWRKDLGTFVSQHGFATSPIVYRGRVLLANQQLDEGLGEREPNKWSSSIVCLDAATGELVWTTPRLSSVASYSVPCIRRAADGTEEIICCSTAHGIYSLDWETGRPKWSLKDAFSMRTVSSPVAVGSVILGSTGSGAGGNYVVAMQIDHEQPELLYKVTRQAPYVPTPVAHGDRVFLWADNGIVTCIQAESGKRLWSHRVGGNYSGSPIRVRDALYCISDDGEVVVLRAGDRFEELGRMELGEPSRSTPAVAGGRMFLRTYSHLFALGSTESQETAPASHRASRAGRPAVPGGAHGEGGP